ncbi:MAG: hypothetical protein M1569_04000 [Candidatus Marsarchaeota archaeon]|nr:hypothetical protein [Candidatus Marsarchaeota archaeon]
MLKTIRGRKHYVSIHYEEPAAIDMADVGACDPNAHTDPIKDILLIAGVNPESQSIFNNACSKLGIISNSNIQSLKMLLIRHRYVKLRVFRGNINQMSRFMHTPCFTSGMLLAFMLDKNLEVIQ